MDAGEGVLGQMARLWGSRGAAAQAAALAAVLISHKHADHVLGVPALLAARPSGVPPLIVIGASTPIVLCTTCAKLTAASCLHTSARSNL